MWLIDLIFQVVFIWFIYQVFLNQCTSKIYQFIMNSVQEYKHNDKENNYKECVKSLINQTSNYISNKDELLQSVKTEKGVSKSELLNVNDFDVIKSKSRIASGEISSNNIDEKFYNLSQDIDKRLMYENKKFSCSEYDIEKVYSIKFNHMGRCKPDNDNLETGFIWFNTENNTINIYSDNHFHEFPVLCRSIIKQYIKRPRKKQRSDCSC